MKSEHHTEPAILFQHRSSPVHFDAPVIPPVTQESVARAMREAEAERAEIFRLNVLREEHKLLLSHMRDCHGSDEIRRWLDSLDVIDTDPRRI